MSVEQSMTGSRLGLTPNMLVDGKYRLEKILGAGGGGEVWAAVEAVDAAAWRTIALKLLKTPERTAGSSPSSPSEHDWLHEARAVSQVPCDAIPQTYTVGTTNLPGYSATPFIAMEMLEGETLEDRLSRGTIHWRKALAIARQIAIALDACHAASVIHCDLKPRNVFLESVHRRRILVLDFGIASLGGVLAKAPITSTSVHSADETDVQAPASSAFPDAPAPVPIMGTPGYISPERLTGLLPDPRDDAFAVGVVLYRMIAGRMPQRLPRGVEVASSHKSGAHPYEIALHQATVERMFEPLENAAMTTPLAVLALVETLLGPVQDRPAKGQLAALFDDVYRRPHGRPSVPYAGLEAFDQRRTGYLPGRASDIEPIVRRLENQVGLVLCGPSGTGKSSLAMAGVAARIDESMLLDKEGWEPLILRPSTIRGGLAVASITSITSDDMPRQTGTGANLSPVGLFVVIDQFEEVLSLNVADRQAFCRAFTALVTRSAAVVAGDRRIEPTDTVRVVATVRDDLFGRVAALPELERLPERNLYMVRGVDPNAARAIVLGPLEGTGFALEDSSDVDVVGDVGREIERDPSALPLVQFALARLWDRRNTATRVLQALSWKNIGGIVGALGEAAQGLYDSLAIDDQQAARRLFLALFDVEGTRHIVDESTLDAAAMALVPRWVAEGLVRRRVEEDGRALIEPLHEALAKGWPQLGRWLDDVRADRELVRDTQRDAKRWERHGKPADMLWGGTLLQQTEVLQGIRTEPAQSFVAASIAAAQRAKKRIFWVNRVLPGAIVGVVLAIALAGWLVTSGAKNEVDGALAESKISEAKAKQSSAEALEQKTIADNARKDAEKAGAVARDAEKATAQLKDKYLEDLEKLQDDVKKAKTTKDFEDLQRRIAGRGEENAAPPVVRAPVPDVLRDRPDPFQ